MSDKRKDEKQVKSLEQIEWEGIFLCNLKEIDVSSKTEN